jgi:hypothetical protein
MHHNNATGILSPSAMDGISPKIYPYLFKEAPDLPHEERAVKGSALDALHPGGMWKDQQNPVCGDLTR